MYFYKHRISQSTLQCSLPIMWENIIEISSEDYIYQLENNTWWIAYENMAKGNNIKLTDRVFIHRKYMQGIYKNDVITSHLIENKQKYYERKKMGEVVKIDRKPWDNL